jgi:[acyl-carrier-protein] S-malonyltransferase
MNDWDGQEGETVAAVLNSCLAAAVCTQNRNHNQEEYDRGVASPYAKLLQLDEDVNSGVVKPDRECLVQALRCLKRIFITKRVPEENRIQRFGEIASLMSADPAFREIRIESLQPWVDETEGNGR